MVARNEHTSLLVSHPSVWYRGKTGTVSIYYHKIPFNASKSKSHYSFNSFTSQNFNKKNVASGVQQTGFMVDIASSAAQETRMFQYHKK